MVLNWRMSTFWATQAVESALRSNGSARLWWLQDCSAAIAANFGEDGFGTAGASTTMANLLTIVTATFQSTATSPDANMLCFYSSVESRISVSSSRSLSFSGSLFSCTTDFRTLVPTTAQVGTTCSSTGRPVLLALMANPRLAGSATATANVDLHQAAATVTAMAF